MSLIARAGGREDDPIEAAHRVLSRSPGVRELEARLGLFPVGLDELHEEREQLSEQIAPLEARYGKDGTAKQRLENLFAMIALEKRRELGAIEDGPKVTEPMVEAAVRADKRYRRALRRQEGERADYYKLRDRYYGIRDTIEWVKALGRRAALEPNTPSGGPR